MMMNDFIEKLRKLRSDLGVSQVKLAELLGVSPAAVAMWESGANALPRATTYVKLLELFQENNIA